MHDRPSDIARVVTAWGRDLATMRQPSETGPTLDTGTREPDGSESGKSIRKDYRSSSRDESYDSDQWGCVVRG